MISVSLLSSLPAVSCCGEHHRRVLYTCEAEDNTHDGGNSYEDNRMNSVPFSHGEKEQHSEKNRFEIEQIRKAEAAFSYDLEMDE